MGTSVERVAYGPQMKTYNPPRQTHRRDTPLSREAAHG